jgi:uncharacterized protein (DUF1684 family)
MKCIVRVVVIVLFSIAGSIALIGQTQGQQSSAGPKLTYDEEVGAWHQQRLAGLQRPHGWLSLVALDWLKEGENSVAGFGTVALNKRTISFKALPGAQTKIRGEAVSSGPLMADVDKVELGSKAFVVIRRGERFAVRMWDANADALRGFGGIERFPVSTAWKIEAAWEAYDKPKPIKVQSVIPYYLEDYIVAGAAVFTVDGKEYRLEPVGEPGARQLFFIFGDKTNGSETYGAGRFLYTEPAKNGKVVLDFNKAINPPCAFSSYATCPLPPASNRLSIRIEAGEKKFGDH